MSKRRGHGEGSIYQRGDGRWVGSINLGYEGGKRKRRTVYGRTQAEVIDKLDALKHAKREGRLVSDERTTVGQFLTRWVTDDLPGTVADSTVDSYRYIVEQHLIPIIGEKRLAKLSPQDVQGLLNAKREQGLSPRTRQYIHAVLRRALNQAERWQLIARNPAALVDTPKVPHVEPQALTVDELHAVLEAVDGWRLEALLVVAVTTGLRLGELVGLSWGDVDLDVGQLAVRRTRRRNGTVAEPKSAAGRRVVPLPPTAVSTLRRYRKAQAEERLAAFSWGDENVVFTTREGQPLGHRYVQRWWYRVCDEAGIDGRAFHQLRKTYTTLLAGGGVHPRVAQQLLGHSDVRLTLETYTSVAPESLTAAIRPIEAAVALRGSESATTEPGGSGLR